LENEKRVAQLRTFLIDRRGRLTPRDVGLPGYGLRRCRGLRREEVAELVGVSAAWYTLFEMARRDRRVSIRMVERVADALRLDDTDRATLYRLAIPELSRVFPPPAAGSPSHT
jgi:hypothetical protein